MIRALALWAVFVAVAILCVVLREERMIARGRVPMGRLRRFWFRAERRRAPRYRVNWPVRYQRVEGGPSTNGHTRDVSQTGAGMTITVLEKIPVGCMIQLELLLPERPGPIQVTGEVVWTREASDAAPAPGEPRLFHAGVRFHNITPEMGSLIAKALGAG